MIITILYIIIVIAVLIASTSLILLLSLLLLLKYNFFLAWIAKKIIGDTFDNALNCIWVDLGHVLRLWLSWAPFY